MCNIDWDEQYANDVRYWQMSDDLLDTLLAELPEAQDFFDVGCGKGEFMKQLMVRGFDVKGIDISKNAVLCAKNNVGSNVVSLGDINTMSLTGSTVIVLKLVLPFVLEKKKILKKIKRYCSVLILIVEVVTDEHNCTVRIRRRSIEELFLVEMIHDLFDSVQLFYVEKASIWSELRIYILR